MLTLLVSLLCALYSPPLADRIVTLPDVHLSRAEAVEHAWAAIVAGALTGEDPAVLAALSWHESRLTSNVVSHEAGGLSSCGVMTPFPVAHCVPTSLVAQYLDGARHVRGWIEAAHGDRHVAFIGVAGGYRLIAACRNGVVARGCVFAETIDAIAGRLR